MNIVYSRHAKRRAKLYGLSEQSVENFLRTLDLCDGQYELISDSFCFQYPVKIVVVVENDIMTVVTNYPLKKGRK
jgi:hypothetical protein